MEKRKEFLGSGGPKEATQGKEGPIELGDTEGMAKGHFFFRRAGKVPCLGADLQGMTFVVQCFSEADRRGVPRHKLKIQHVYQPCERWEDERCAQYRFEFIIASGEDLEVPKKPTEPRCRRYAERRIHEGTSLCKGDMAEVWRCATGASKREPLFDLVAMQEDSVPDDTQPPSHAELNIAGMKIALFGPNRGGDPGARRSDALYHPSHNAIALRTERYDSNSCPLGSATPAIVDRKCNAANRPIMPDKTIQFACAQDALGKLELERIARHVEGHGSYWRLVRQVLMQPFRQSALKMVTGNYCDCIRGTVHAAGLLLSTYGNCRASHARGRTFESQCFGDNVVEAVWGVNRCALH